MPKYSPRHELEGCFRDRPPTLRYYGQENLGVYNFGSMIPDLPHFNQAVPYSLAVWPVFQSLQSVQFGLYFGDRKFLVYCLARRLFTGQVEIPFGWSLGLKGL